MDFSPPGIAPSSLPSDISRSSSETLRCRGRYVDRHRRRWTRPLERIEIRRRSAWNRRSRRWISGKTIGSGPFLPPEVLRLPCVPSFRRLLRLPACSGCRRRKSRNNTRLDDRRSHDFVIHRRRRTVFEFVVIVESDSLCSYPRSVVEDPRRPEVGLEDVRFDLVGSFSV